VSFIHSYDVPPGWYPDPSGARQWRVWNGTGWTALTKPYGEVVATPRFAANLSLVQALRRVRGAGVVGVLGGLGLLVGVLAHWPGTAHPVPQWFALAASQLAVALLLVGTIVCAFGVRELDGRWSFGAFVPVVNFFIASALVTRRLGRVRVSRLFAEVVLLVLFALSSKADLWLFASPMIVAYVETSWFAALIDQLSGSSPIDEKSAS
jgi:hypothetical protein